MSKASRAEDWRPSLRSDEQRLKKALEKIEPLMRVVVYDELGDIALDYYTHNETVSLCFAEGGVFHHGSTGTVA
jgi:hypothetical protein